MRVFIGFILCLVILAIGGVIYIFSGMYDVSVANRDKGISRWILETTMENSVEHHSRNVEIPSLDDSLMILKGYVHYSRMCGCHGNPGRESSKTFNPEPPELYRTAGEWQPNELFWSGMPSFSTRVSDDEIWETVAFLRVLPKLNPDQYKAMETKAKKAGFIERH
ncbi:MAG: cytochrome c [Ignavibacteriaceae bacterium]